MQKTNLCPWLLSILGSIFLGELVFLASYGSLGFYPTQIFALLSLLFIPLSWVCGTMIILIATANSSIYSIAPATTSILLITAYLLAPLIQANLLPRLRIFIPLLLIGHGLWLWLNPQTSTTLSWHGTLLLVLFGALLWNTVRKTVAKSSL